MVQRAGLEPASHDKRLVPYSTCIKLSLHIARLFRAVNQALQILFSPKLHIAGTTITHSPLALWTFGFTLCSHSLFNCLTHRGCLIFLSRIVPSAALWGLWWESNPQRHQNVHILLFVSRDITPLSEFTAWRIIIMHYNYSLQPCIAILVLQMGLEPTLYGF